MTPFFRIVCLSLALCFGASSVRAEGLKSAQVSRIFNDVKLLPENQAPRPATVADTVSGKAAVQTGAASRSELMFTDKTLTRLGANSFFSFVNGTRDMNLGSGTMLLQVPKGAGGAEIHTAAVTAAITGTTLMVEFNPKSYSKIIVLEGTVRVFLTRRIGESVLVHAGQMVIVPPGAASMPEPVSVDLKVLYATSGLINDFGPLASRGLIDREVTKQRKDITGGKLVDTNLFIVGRGTEVQEGHLSFISGQDHNITARQSAHFPVALGESTTRPVPPPPTPPVATPTPPVTPTPELPTPSLPPTPTPVSPTPTPVSPTPTPTPATPTPTPATPTPTPATPTPTPTAVPTATPPPTPTPTPTPTATPSPSPSPGSTKNGPLPLIANNGNVGATPAYLIDGTTAIRTDPFITTQGVQDEGRIYRGGTAASPATPGSVDGLPSAYFLGATGGPTTFDTQVGFDRQFGTIGDVGGFKFTNLTITANPASISTVDGPTSLVFVATGRITDPVNFSSAPVTNNFDLRGLSNVLFVTQNGPIIFTNGLTFANSGETATALTLYARGGPLVTGGANVAFNLPGSVLNFYSDTSVTIGQRVGPDEAAGAGAINIISGGDLSINALLHSTGDITATTVAGGGDINLGSQGAIFIEAGDFNATSGATININGGIDTVSGNVRLVAASGVNLFSNITAQGNVRLEAAGGDVFTDSETLIQSNGIFTAKATTGNLTLNGTVGATEDNAGAGTPTAANLTAGLDLRLTSSLAATNIQAQASGLLQLTGATLTSGENGNVTLVSTGGDIILDEDSTVNMNGGTFKANANQHLYIDGMVGHPEFGRPGRAGGGSAVVEGQPDYATGTAGNGITVNGAIATGGTGGGQSTDENGIELTATGGDLSIGGTLETFGGGIALEATTGAMTISGYVYGGAGDVTLTSGSDMNLNGSIYASGGSLQGTSNQGALNVGPVGYVSANGDVTLFGSSGLSIVGTATAGSTLTLSTSGPLSVSGSASGGSFNATSYGSSLTVANDMVSSRPASVNAGGGSIGSFSAYGPIGTVSSLSAPDKTNGAMAINGTVYVGAGEIDFTAGTTFSNDPIGSSITATHVEVTAGTTATLNFSRFHYGGDEDPSVMNVHAQTIIGTTDTSGYNISQGITPLNLYATGAITLSGNLGVETLQGGNLTLLPSSLLTVTNLNTTGPTGAFVIGNSYFRLLAGTNANAVGPVTLDGSPLVQLEGSLAVAGGISTTASNQIPSLNLSLQSTLTATGSIALGAGNLNGSSGTTVTTNSTLTTTGDATISTLNAFGGFTVGTLSAGTVTLRDVNGNLPANPPASMVSGAVTPYRFNTGTVNTFTIGRFTAGALSFAGSSNPGEDPAAFSLTLTTIGNFGVGAGGMAGFTGSADFSGGSKTVDFNGGTGGSGGVFRVTALPNTFAGTAGNIRVQDNGTGVVPVITSMGGNVTATTNGFAAVGGVGGQLVLNSAAVFSASNGANVTAAGGNVTDAGSTGSRGGAGGVVALNAGTDLTLTGGTGTAGTTTGPVVVSAQGGSLSNSFDGSTGGTGGTIGLLAGGAVTLNNTQINARGGDNLTIYAVSSFGDARGGTITVQSNQASAPTASTVAITGSSLNASSGQVSSSFNQPLGTGGTINIVSNDTAAAGTPVPASSPPSGSTPPPAILISASTVATGQAQPSGTPGSGTRVGGTINVTSARTRGPGISVQDSSSLLALVDSRTTAAGGKVNLTTQGADISVVGNSTVGATGPGGTLTMTTNAAGAGGVITVGSPAFTDTATRLNADVLNILAHGSDGAVVINAGSTLSAATQLRLYADGSRGSITFQGGNITLNTGSVAGIVAAPTITIRTGTTVTVNGSQTLRIFTDVANYSAGNGGNNSTGGTFAGAARPTGSPSPFASRPPLVVAPVLAVATPSKAGAAPTLAGLTTAATGKTPARGPIAPRLLRQGKTVLLVEPVAQSKAVAEQNRALLQSLAVTPQSGRPASVDRVVKQRTQKDRTTAASVARPVNRPGTMAGGAGLLR